MNAIVGRTVSVKKRLGRPPIRGPKTSEEILTVRLPTSLKKRLKRFATEQHKALATAIRELLVEGLERYGG